MPSLGVRIAMVGGLASAAGLAWLAGTAIAGLRGPRPATVIWYEAGIMGLGALWVPLGLAAMWARRAPVAGWEGAPSDWIAGLCFLAAAMMALIVFRYRLTLSNDALIERRVFRPGVRRILWSEVQSWRPGRRDTSVILVLSSGGRFEFAADYKVGAEAFYEAVEMRGIPEV